MNLKRFFLIGISFLIPLSLIAFFVILILRAPEAIKPTLTAQQKQLYIVGGEQDDNPINVQANVLPQFAIKLVEEKFKNMWTAHAAERENLVKSGVVSARGDASLSLDTTFNESNKQLIVTPKTENKFKPGLYTLNVKVKTYQGEETTITQDFTWGVLALNTNKAYYQKGDTVDIGMAVLDDYGMTKCIARNKQIVFGTARLWLTITSPSGKKEEFSTDDGTIQGSKTCADRSFTNIPDFLAHTMASEVGRYMMHIEAENHLGVKGMDSYFYVRESVPYQIERVQYPMRIYPRFNYPVKIRVTANRDFNGTVYDTVPSNFQIFDVSGGGDVQATEPYKSVEWQVSFEKGKTYTLSYTIKFPYISPEFYLVGPLKIGEFSEGREWQVASDSIFTLVQEAHATATTGTSLAANFLTDATPGNLLILICARDQNTTINTPSGYTRRYRYTSNAPRLSHFDRLVPASPAISTGTCSFSSNGSIATTFLEFSGNSSSGYFDKVAGPTRSTNCNTGAHQSVGSNITPTNPDELLVSGFVSTAGNLTVSAHNSITGAGSSGFTDTDTSGGDGFSDANASYDSGWGEAVNNPATVQHDTATFSGAATACTQGVVAYNAAITISQGSYQFFENTDSANPTTVFGGTATENSPITLAQPNYPFRLRMLLDVDSATGSLGVDAGDFILQYAAKPASGNCADGTYAQVLDPSGGTPIAYNPNATPASGDAISATANDPSDTATYTTVLENYFEDTNIGVLAYDDISNDQNAIANNQAGLFDLSLIDNSDDSTSFTYCLKITDASGNDLAAYRNYPEITTIPLDVNIRGGSTINGGTTIQ